MPIQAPQWTDFLVCPVCENGFELKTRLPISLGCGHSVCKTCLANLQRNVCPFDQTTISIPLEKLPVNTALVLLIDPEAPLKSFRPKSSSNAPLFNEQYNTSMHFMEQLATFLKPSNSQPLSRPMQRKLVTLINCQLLEEEGRLRAIRSARSLGERSVTELILQHQNPQQLSANLWAAVRTRGCQFLGPAMQEEVLKLVLLALEDGSALSRKVLVMFVVQRLEPHFPQASKTSIGHVVQLLYRASCFIVTKRDGDSSLMQLKDEFRTYDSLRREHDAQIVQIATEAGLRIAPDQWSSLLYGDTNHKSHMQSIIDKLQTPQSFVQSIQELVIALQRTGDPGKLTSLRTHLDLLSGIDTSPDSNCSDWSLVEDSLNSCCLVVTGLIKFITLHSHKRSSDTNGSSSTHTRYKTSMCRDLTAHNSCPRGKNCTFAHSQVEIDQYRQKRGRSVQGDSRDIMPPASRSSPQLMMPLQRSSRMSSSTAEMSGPPPVAQVAPVPRELVTDVQPTVVQMVRPNNQQQQHQQQAMYENYGHVPLVHAGIPMGEMLHPSQTLVPVVRSLQGPPGSHVMSPPVHLQHHMIPADNNVMQQSGSMQMMPDHINEMHRQSAVAQAKTMHSLATKSLSALKSRKEEIIDSLQDLVGKDETKKISNLTTERANTLQNLQNVIDDRGASYSMWNSQFMANLPPIGQGGHQGQYDEDVAERGRPEDDLIPFSDTPQISRFGPISRRIICPQSLPTQSQAIIGDETKPTSVVRHAKHMSRPVPAAASLLHQNGTRTTLQPVAVGVNGEIGYIAIPEPPIAVGAAAAAADINMQHIHQSNLVSPVHRAMPMAAQPPPQSNMDPQTTGLLAESERMRQRLEILQMKISSLNMARMNGLPPPTYQDPIFGEREQLTSELQLIENTIQDREREIKINHLRNETAANTLEDDGAFNNSQNQSLDGQCSGSIGITTTAKSGQVPRNGRREYFDHF